MQQFLFICSCVAFVLSAHGEPWLRHTVDDAGKGADGVRLADVNGDGHPDIATAWEEAGEIRVYLNPGPDAVRARWTKVMVGRVATPEDAVFVDLDRDGAVDVVSSCEGKERSVYVHWAPSCAVEYLDESAWRTQVLEASRDQMQWMYCLPLDVDDDGDLDLVAGAKGAGAALGWFQCPEDPRDTTAWQWHSFVRAGWIMSIEAFDMNDDGRVDIVVSDRRGDTRGVYWLEHPATPGEDWPQHRIGPVNTEEAMFLSVQSRDEGGSGGVGAVFCAIRERLIVRYTPARDDGWDRQEIEIPRSYGTAKGVAVLPSSTPEQALVALSCEHAEDKHGVGLLLSTPQFSTSPNSLSGHAGAKFDQVLWCDIDSDGDLDLVTTEEREGLGVIWYESDLASPED